jgi:hybrid cluster-associated redox disulfide protein
MEITKDTNIGQMVKEHPETIKVLAENNFGCIGCSIAHQETIGEGAKAHGLSDEQIDKLIDDLNNSIKE